MPDVRAKAMKLWKETLNRRKVGHALKQYELVEKSFKQWEITLDKKLLPQVEEIEKFLWLM